MGDSKKTRIKASINVKPTKRMLDEIAANEEAMAALKHKDGHEDKSDCFICIDKCKCDDIISKNIKNKKRIKKDN
jgi:hypothetical protein